jgi:hypothetical protein
MADADRVDPDFVGGDRAAGAGADGGWIGLALIVGLGAGMLIGAALMLTALGGSGCPSASGSLPPSRNEPVAFVLPHIGETVRPPLVRQGDARAVVEFIAPEAVAVECRGSLVATGTWGEALSCARMYPGRPTLVLPNPCAFPFDDYATLVCHELGHVNGWKHEREDAA